MWNKFGEELLLADLARSDCPAAFTSLLPFACCITPHLNFPSPASPSFCFRLSNSQNFHSHFRVRSVCVNIFFSTSKICVSRQKTALSEFICWLQPNSFMCIVNKCHNASMRQCRQPSSELRTTWTQLAFGMQFIPGRIVVQLTVSVECLPVDHLRRCCVGYRQGLSAINLDVRQCQPSLCHCLCSGAAVCVADDCSPCKYQ